MKRTAKILSVCFALLLACGSLWGCGEGGKKPEGEEYRTLHLLRDAKFRKGFDLLGMDSATDSGVCKVINYGEASNRPQWQLAQWWSDYNLKDGEESISPESYSLIDQSKTVKLDRESGALTLGLNGAEEFETFNPSPPARWPHLLISQSVEGDYWLKDADKVNATLRFTLDKSENLRGGTAGCQAQFAWFIYLVDRNPESEGYGNFLWFGLNLYDSTKLYTQGTAMQDTAGGPGNFIYTLGYKDIFAGRVKVGEEIAFTLDIKPHVEAALAKAQESGFMLGTTVEDCVITGHNIGWEVFDRFDVAVTLREIGIDFLSKK